MSVRRVEDITEALWGSRVSPGTVSNLTSMKPADIIVDGAKHYGVQMFRSWLEYCRTVQIVGSRRPGGDTGSPFEDCVARQIRAMGCEVVPQVGVAVFRIDLGVRHPEWPCGYILGVECDGATYHSSKSSRDRDRLRQEVLEGLGWRLHRIWSTDWFRNPRSEIDILREAIETALAEVRKLDVVPAEVPDATAPGGVGGNAQPSEDRGDALKNVEIQPPRINNLREFRQGDLLSETPATRPFTLKVVNAVPVVTLGSKVKVESIRSARISRRSASCRSGSGLHEARFSPVCKGRPALSLGRASRTSKWLEEPFVRLQATAQEGDRARQERLVKRTRISVRPAFRAQRYVVTREHVPAFAKTLERADHMVIEATGNRRRRSRLGNFQTAVPGSLQAAATWD